ncbi:uncharacterized protein LAESUDRAFT_180754 [Laetiporus sulphureus 93-53]|uniref:Uncharacterized protein n=1 Tax=Laetiporus sulphureus 93-53 TaxID=1314785 RepID=A0A165E8Z3_9APHY|nr:uncharacterized protein LAESUDRAFT_180754 [Laetiporus sulphureus 93-53]KZT06495.1 hypothetical protein LAESUDRAFT_180754 [Laetiporus sulphureus 93-53]
MTSWPAANDEDTDKPKLDVCYMLFVLMSYQIWLRIAGIVGIDIAHRSTDEIAVRGSVCRP